MTSHLQTISVTRTYDGVRALDDVNIATDLGQITSIVGVNGAGKTTLLKILAGLDMPNSGEVLIANHQMGPEELRRQCTMVFQRSVMFGASVYENVAYGLRISHVGRQQIPERVRSALQTVNLDGFEKRNARKLSGGEQQRVAIARALAIERDVLLVDEPTANLDPANSMIIEGAIREARETRVVILSTHNLPQARRLSDRMIHLYKGRVVEQAMTSDFFARPHDERTKLFISGELQF